MDDEDFLHWAKDEAARFFGTEEDVRREKQDYGMSDEDYFLGEIGRMLQTPVPKGPHHVDTGARSALDELDEALGDIQRHGATHDTMTVQARPHRTGPREASSHRELRSRAHGAPTGYAARRLPGKQHAEHSAGAPAALARAHSHAGGYAAAHAAARASGVSHYGLRRWDSSTAVEGQHMGTSTSSGLRTAAPYLPPPAAPAPHPAAPKPAPRVWDAYEAVCDHGRRSQQNSHGGARDACGPFDWAANLRRAQEQGRAVHTAAEDAVQRLLRGPRSVVSGVLRASGRFCEQMMRSADHVLVADAGGARGQVLPSALRTAGSRGGSLQGSRHGSPTSRAGSRAGSAHEAQQAAPPRYVWAWVTEKQASIGRHAASQDGASPVSGCLLELRGVEAAARHGRVLLQLGFVAAAPETVPATLRIESGDSLTQPFAQIAPDVPLAAVLGRGPVPMYPVLSIDPTRLGRYVSLTFTGLADGKKQGGTGKAKQGRREPARHALVHLAMSSSRRAPGAALDAAVDVHAPIVAAPAEDGAGLAAAKDDAPADAEGDGQRTVPPKGAAAAPAREPTKPTVRLFWSKIAARQAEGSVWSQMDLEDFAAGLDFESLEEAFQAKQSGSSGTATAIAAALARAREAHTSVLDLQRARNVQIVLARVRIPLDDLGGIVQRLATAGFSGPDGDAAAAAPELSANDVQALLTAMPTDAEARQLCAYVAGGGDVARLDPADRFMLRCLEVPQLGQRLRAIRARASVGPRTAALAAAADTIERACAEVRGSDTLRAALGIILAVGNFLNAGNKAAGNARGFALETLARLKSVRDTRPGQKNRTLLHFVASELVKWCERAGKPLSSLRLVGGLTASADVVKGGVPPLSGEAAQIARELDAARDAVLEIRAATDAAAAPDAGGPPKPPPGDTKGDSPGNTSQTDGETIHTTEVDDASSAKDAAPPPQPRPVDPFCAGMLAVFDQAAAQLAEARAAAQASEDKLRAVVDFFEGRNAAPEARQPAQFFARIVQFGADLDAALREVSEPYAAEAAAKDAESAAARRASSAEPSRRAPGGAQTVLAVKAYARLPPGMRKAMLTERGARERLRELGIVRRHSDCEIDVLRERFGPDAAPRAAAVVAGGEGEAPPRGGDEVARALYSPVVDASGSATPTSSEEAALRAPRSPDAGRAWHEQLEAAAGSGTAREAPASSVAREASLAWQLAAEAQAHRARDAAHAPPGEQHPGGGAEGVATGAIAEESDADDWLLDGTPMSAEQPSGARLSFCCDTPDTPPDSHSPPDTDAGPAQDDDDDAPSPVLHHTVTFPLARTPLSSVPESSRLTESPRDAAPSPLPSSRNTSMGTPSRFLATTPPASPLRVPQGVGRAMASAAGNGDGYESPGPEGLGIPVSVFTLSLGRRMDPDLLTSHELASGMNTARSELSSFSADALGAAWPVPRLAVARAMAAGDDDWNPPSTLRAHEVADDVAVTARGPPSSRRPQGDQRPAARMVDPASPARGYAGRAAAQIEQIKRNADGLRRKLSDADAATPSSSASILSLSTAWTATPLPPTSALEGPDPTSEPRFAPSAPSAAPAAKKKKSRKKKKGAKKKKAKATAAPQPAAPAEDPTPTPPPAPLRSVFSLAAALEPRSLSASGLWHCPSPDVRDSGGERRPAERPAAEGPVSPVRRLRTLEGFRAAMVDMVTSPERKAWRSESDKLRAAGGKGDAKKGGGGFRRVFSLGRKHQGAPS
ncbi:unnamed protein product [Pedinophyceae sp. YPF-701]|nr:unnamed protein product [Pedinophyceae sp. YPF-701]